MDTKHYHFLSGLPRTGSTVLASILSQNPSIYVSATSPLVGLMHGAKHMWDTAEHVKAYATEGQIEATLRGMINGFYSLVERPIILDKNRAWANPENQDMLTLALGVPPKIVCTVRPIADILASFMVLIRKNSSTVSFVDQSLIELGEDINDVNRCKLLMSPDGHVFQSWSVLRMGWERYPEHMLFVEYDDLVSAPERELARVYEFLALPPFAHDLQHIQNTVQEDDIAAYHLPGMHAIRPALGKISHDAREVLGDELFAQYQGGEFWKTSERL